MRKQDFLDELKNTLSGEVPAEVMMDSYRYYAGYIEEKMAAGMKEEMVIEELGKPSLIARSIIAAWQGDRVADEEYTEGGKSRRMKREYHTETKRSQKRERKFVFDYRAWYAKILYIMIVLFFIIMVFFLLKGLFLIFITVGIPILLGLGILYLIVNFFNGK